MTADFMLRALALAREAKGSTSPNPPVGAVLVKDGRIIGEGRTQPPGGPHAERVALARAGETAPGATLYVTLEPCSHWGRTPPCTDGIIEAGVAEVRFAGRDPNPLVGGDGVRRLKAAGVKVVEDARREARELIAPHGKYVTVGLPLVTLAVGFGPDQIRGLAEEFDRVVTEWTAGQVHRGGRGGTGSTANHGATEGRRHAESNPWPSEKVAVIPPRALTEEFLRAVAAEGDIDLMVVGSEEMERGALEERLVDRMLLAPGVNVPAGWRTRQSVIFPSQRVAYPEASVVTEDE